MKYSLGISNFLEEISNLSRSIFFLYFFALITEEPFLISPWYPLEVWIQMGISFSFRCSCTLHIWKNKANEYNKIETDSQDKDKTSDYLWREGREKGQDRGRQRQNQLCLI